MMKSRLLTWRALAPSILISAVMAAVFLMRTADLPQARVLGQNQYWIRSLVFSPDGTMLAAAGGVDHRKQELALWDVATGQRRTILLGEGLSIEGLAFSPDGKWLGLVQCDLSVKLLDAASGAEQASFSSPPCWQQCLFFSPDSQELVVLGSQGHLTVWNVASRTVRRSRGPGGCDMFCACRSGILCSARGSEIDGFEGSTACVWDVALGQERSRFRIPSHTLWSAAAISADGETVALATSDGGLAFFNLPSGRSWFTPPPHEHADPINCLVFCADGQTLVSGGQDHAVKLWDVKTGEEIATLGQHEAAVFAVDIAPDGRQVASGSFDKTVRLWNIEGLRPHSTASQSHPGLATGACLGRWFGPLVKCIKAD
jgi:WD40 repeat protein